MFGCVWRVMEDFYRNFLTATASSMTTFTIHTPRSVLARSLALLFTIAIHDAKWQPPPSAAPPLHIRVYDIITACVCQLTAGGVSE